MKTVELSVVNF